MVSGEKLKCLDDVFLVARSQNVGNLTNCSPNPNSSETEKRMDSEKLDGRYTVTC